MANSGRLFKGKTGLLLHRNFLAAVDGFGKQLAKEFQQETGILVRCDFVNRSAEGMKIRFRPIQLSKTGDIDFNKSMKHFIKNKLSYIQSYLAAAVMKTLGDSALVETKLESGQKATGQWMGDSSFGIKKQDANSLKIDWAGAK
jgi:hypothetical protein